MLILKLTSLRRSIHIPNYSVYDTQHPDGTAHGGTAIIIKYYIKHHLHWHYNREHLQATASLLTTGSARSQLRQSTAP